MNWEETAYWVDGLLPGTPSIEVRSGFHIGITTTAAQDNDAATAAASPASGQQSPAGDTIAVTLDFSDIDTGLEHEGRDVRCELLAVAHPPDIRRHLVTVARSLLNPERSCLTRCPRRQHPMCSLWCHGYGTGPCPNSMNQSD